MRCSQRKALASMRTMMGLSGRRPSSNFNISCCLFFPLFLETGISLVQEPILLHYSFNSHPDYPATAVFKVCCKVARDALRPSTRHAVPLFPLMHTCSVLNLRFAHLGWKGGPIFYEIGILPCHRLWALMLHWCWGIAELHEQWIVLYTDEHFLHLSLSLPGLGF